MGDNIKYVFIVGSPRSGTTLLEILLGRHPEIFVAPETKLFYFYHNHPKFLAKRNLKHLGRELSVDFSKAFIDKLPSTLEVLESIAGQYRDKQSKAGAKVFCEKSNEHSWYIKDILENIPDAKFIVLTRDGRDVAASLAKVPWAQFNLLSGIEVWKSYVRELAKWQDDDRLLFVKFEDILNSPEQELNRIQQYLDLERQEDLLTDHRTSCLSILEREMEWKHLALEPILKSRAQNWKLTMKQGDIAKLEASARDELSIFAYELTTAAKPMSLLLKAEMLFSVAKLTLTASTKHCIAEVIRRLT